MTGIQNGKNESESPFRRAFLFGVFQSRKGMELEKLVPIHTLKPWRIWGNQFVQLGLFTPGYLVPQICEHLLDIVRSSSGVHVVNPKSFSDIPVECCGCSPLTEVIIYGFRSKSWGVNGWIMMTAIHHGNPWYLGSLANIPIAFYSILSLLGWNFTNRTPGTPGTPGDTGGHRGTPVQGQDGWWIYKYYRDAQGLHTEWPQRQELLRKQIQQVDPDIFCLQDALAKRHISCYRVVVQTDGVAEYTYSWIILIYLEQSIL